MVGLERFPDKQSFQRYQVRLQAAWEQFMSGESRTPDPSVVPFRIAESWKRSQGYGLDPFHYQSFVKMKKLNIKNRETQLLTDETAGYWLGDLAKKYAFNVSVFDAQGNDIALMPERDHALSFANEMILGTNAAALALLENRPGCVLAQEHYSRFFHPRFCVAAPFRETDQNVVGAVCISTLNFEIIHSLAEMVEQFAEICTQIFNLAHQLPSDDDEMLRAVLASLANLSAPLLYVDAQDKLQTLSRRARELLAGCRDDKESAGRQLRLCLNEDQGHGPQPQTGGRKVSRTDVSPERLLPEMARPECSMEFSDIIGSTPQIKRFSFIEAFHHGFDTSILGIVRKSARYPPASITGTDE